MSGKYPNGGYRNATARELSMPAEAAPPPVTAKPASGSGNTVHMQKSPRLSDMLGNGRGLAGPNQSGNVRVDLRGFADANADRLGYSPTDHLRRGNYGTGTHNVTIDLDPKSYRVNGRGYLMRQAIKAARSILKFNRRLPRNIWKELVVEILNQLLGYAASHFPVPGEAKTDVSAGPDWVFRSYGTSDGFALGVDGVQMETKPFASDLAQARAFANAGVGFYIISTTYYDPLNYGTGPEPAYSAPLGSQSVSPRPNNINNNYGLWEFHFQQVINNPRYRHVATFRRRRASALLPDIRLLAGVSVGALNAPYSDAGPKSGGNHPPGGGYSTFPEPANDKKYFIPWLRGALSLAYAATELGDSIDCIYKALPKYRRYGRDYTDKMQRIYENFDEIQWDKALTCLAINQVTDPIIGRGFDFVDKAVGRATTSGFWAPGQITYGSGPGALELTF